MEIVFPGNPEVLAGTLRGLVAALGYGTADGYIGAVAKLGLLVSLLFVLLGALNLRNGLRLDKLVLHFVVVAAALLPTTTVTISSYDDRNYSVPAVVDNVPIFAAIPLSVTTILGSEIAQRVQLAMTPLYVENNAELFCDNVDAGAGLALDTRRCSFSRAFIRSVRYITAQLGVANQATLSWQHNKTQFNRYCDPDSNAPRFESLLRKSVLSEWDAFCSSTRYKQNVAITWLPVGVRPKTGNAGETITETGQAPELISCATACSRIRDLIADSPAVFAGCEGSSECAAEMSRHADRLYAAANAAAGLASDQLNKSLVVACSLADYAGRSALGAAGVEQLEQMRDCVSWARQMQQKLDSVERARESVQARAATLFVMLAVMLPLVALLVAFVPAVGIKALAGYAGFAAAITLTPAVMAAGDAMFARQLQDLVPTLANSVSVGNSFYCDTSASGTGCAASVMSYLRDALATAEALAEHQNQGVLALVTLLTSIMAMAGFAGGGAAVSSQSAGGSASSASGSGQTFGQAYAAARVATAAELTGTGPGFGEQFGSSIDRFASYGFLKQASASLYSANLQPGAGAVFSSGSAALSATNSSAQTASVDKNAQKSSQIALTNVEQANIREAVNTVVQSVRDGSVATVSGLQQQLAAVGSQFTGKARETFDKWAADFSARVGGQLGSGGGGAGLGGALNAGVGGAANMSNGGAVTTRSGRDARLDENTNASRGVQRQYADRFSDAVAKAADEALQRTFSATSSNAGTANESGGTREQATNSDEINARMSAPAAGDMQGAMLRDMLDRGIMLNSAGMRDHMQSKLARAGLSQEQVQQFMGAFDSEMQRLSSYAAGAGSLGAALAAAASTASLLQAKRETGALGLASAYALAGFENVARDVLQRDAAARAQAAQTQNNAQAFLQFGEQVRSAADAQIAQGMQIAQQIAGNVLTNELANEVRAQLQQIQASSKQLDTAAVKQALANALNKVAGTNYSVPQIEQVLKSAQALANRGIEGFRQSLRDAGLDSNAIAAIEAGAVGLMVKNAAGGAAAAAAGAGAKALELGARVAPAAGRALVAGAAGLRALSGAAGPAGWAFLALDVGVAAATGKSLTARAIDAATSFFASQQQPATATAPAAGAGAGVHAVNSAADPAAAAAPAPGAGAGAGVGLTFDERKLNALMSNAYQQALNDMRVRDSNTSALNSFNANAAHINSVLNAAPTPAAAAAPAAGAGVADPAVAPGAAAAPAAGAGVADPAVAPGAAAAPAAGAGVADPAVAPGAAAAPAAGAGVADPAVAPGVAVAPAVGAGVADPAVAPGAAAAPAAGAGVADPAVAPGAAAAPAAGAGVADPAVAPGVAVAPAVGAGVADPAVAPGVAVAPAVVAARAPGALTDAAVPLHNSGGTYNAIPVNTQTQQQPIV